MNSNETVVRLYVRDILYTFEQIGIRKYIHIYFLGCVYACAPMRASYLFIKSYLSREGISLSLSLSIYPRIIRNRSRGRSRHRDRVGRRVGRRFSGFKAANQLSARCPCRF